MCFSHPFHHAELFRYVVVLHNDVKTIILLICFSHPFYHEELSFSGRSTQWCQNQHPIDVFQSSFLSRWTLSLSGRSTWWCQNHHPIDMFQLSFPSWWTLSLSGRSRCARRQSSAWTITFWPWPSVTSARLSSPILWPWHPPGPTAGSSGRQVVSYWPVQAGLLTPLTFTRHRLGRLAVFLLPVRTFFTIGGSDSKFAKFTVPTLKAFLKTRSQNVSSNKQ